MSVRSEKRFIPVRFAKAAGTAFAKDRRSTIIPGAGSTGGARTEASMLSPFPRGSMLFFLCLHRHRYNRTITMIATPAILLTTLPMITGVGVAAAVLDTPLPSATEVLDGDIVVATPFPPPKMSPVPAAVGSGDVPVSNAVVLEAASDRLDTAEDLREVREDLEEVLLKIVELEKLLRDKLLEPEITR